MVRLNIRGKKVYYRLSKNGKYEKKWSRLLLHLNHQIKLIKYLTSLCLYRDLSYLYLPSACDLGDRFFLKSLSINVLFGNIDRKIGQVFPWGINTLTFPPKEWGAEPTPHSPPSREGSGGGGFGREPTPHCRVIYSYIHILLLKRAPHCRFYICILKRAPHCRFLDDRVFLEPRVSNERRTSVFLMVYFLKSLYSKERRTAVFH